jgi:hypothetical protein
VALAARQLAVGPRCTGKWGWRQRNGEKQRGGASELGLDRGGDKGDSKRGCTWGGAILGAVETGAAAVSWARRWSVGGGDSVLGGDVQPSALALGAGYLAGGPWPTKTRRPALIKWAGPISTKKIVSNYFKLHQACKIRKLYPLPSKICPTLPGCRNIQKEQLSFREEVQIPNRH